MRPWMLALAILVLVAGCVNIGNGGIAVNRGGDTDISDMVDISLYYKPARPVEPGESFEIKLKARNLHPKIDLENFVCNINDDGIFTLLSKPYEPSILFRKSAKIFTYEFRVPPPSIVVNNIQTSIGYKCSYSHQARSTLVYAVYSKEAYNQYNEQGKTLTVGTAHSQGEGPLKIELSLGDSNVVRQGTREMLIAVLKNTGQNGFIGTVKGFRNFLPPGSIEIWIEKEPLKDCNIENPSGRMECHQSEKEGIPFCRCINTKDIRFIEGESEPIQLMLKFRDGITDHTKQFTIQAFADYDYIIDGSVDVEVRAR